MRNFDQVELMATELQAFANENGMLFFLTTYSDADWFELLRLSADNIETAKVFMRELTSIVALQNDPNRTIFNN